ncbi:MAG: hypothetical protein NVSMB6_12020 [Burkholderiaceae bacterium]
MSERADGASQPASAPQGADSVDARCACTNPNFTRSKLAAAQELRRRQDASGEPLNRTNRSQRGSGRKEG